MSVPLDLSKFGIHVQDVIRNASTARLYEYAIIDHDAVIAMSGALATRSGDKTGCACWTGRPPCNAAPQVPTRGNN